MVAEPVVDPERVEELEEEAEEEIHAFDGDFARFQALLATRQDAPVRR